uniref:SCAN domain-containing protein n=1 Tax=Meloidogyne javanica TaxID=6303 RepID=A0A915LCA5_MELJA
MDNTTLLCCSCNKTTTGGHYCKICKKPCHAIELCSVSCGEEGYGTKVICSDCFIDVEVVEDSSEEENEDVSKKAFTHVYASDETSISMDPEGGLCVSEEGAKTNRSYYRS